MPARPARAAATATGSSAAGPMLSALAPNLCADVAGESHQAGTPVIVWGCWGGANQQFVMQPNGSITAYDGALCLDASPGTLTDGDPVIAWPCHGGPNQHWARTAAGELVTPNGKCLDVAGQDKTWGTHLIIWTCWGGANQQWTVAGVTTPTPTPTPTPPPAVATWTFCSAAGAPCTFTGLRTVRLAGPSGAAVQVTAYHTIPCATYGFGGQNPAPNQALHCDYGPLLTTTLSNPMPGMGGLGAVVTVPLGSPGVAGPQVQPTSDSPAYTDGSGSFRTTCSLATFAFDDPIVYPGQPGASHLHAFFGNTGVNASSTGQSLTTSGSSTCRGGTLNRTAYWVPAVVDARTGAVQVPDEAVLYYKTGYNVDPRTVQPFPAGLRMVAGNKAAAAHADQPYGILWGCRDASVPNTGAIPTACPVGDAVRLTIIFPQCWDGQHLDAPDHRSHLAYPEYRNAPQRSTCPADHPVALPELTEHFDYPVSAQATPAAWRLSSDMYAPSLAGGYSAHADWMNGWEPATMQALVTQCLNKGVDCGVGGTGNGQTLY